MPISEKRLRHIEAQIEAANTEDDWFQLGHEHIEELLAALREPGVRIPLDMARRLVQYAIVAGIDGYETDDFDSIRHDREELSRLIREEEECGGRDSRSH